MTCSCCSEEEGEGQLLKCLTLLHSLPCAWGAPAAQFNSLIESGQGGTAGMETSLAPEIVLQCKILAEARPCKDGETPLFIALSKIATRDLDTKSSNIYNRV